MKKVLCFAFLLLTLTTGSTFAQCTPDPNATALFSPLPSAPLPSGTVGTPYAQVITMKVPADTTIDLSAIVGFPISPVTATIVDLTVGVVSGLPIGIFGSINPSSGIIVGGTSGCMDVAGTPTTSGQYVINIPSQLTITIPPGVPVIGGTNQTIPAPVPYNLEIVGGVAVNPRSVSGFTVEQNLPNPAGGMTVIRYSVSDVSDMQLEVMNLAGQRLYSDVQKSVVGEQYFRVDVSDFASGIYLYRLSDGSKSISKKMVVN